MAALARTAELGDVAHALNNALMVVTTYVELLELAPAEDHEDLHAQLAASVEELRALVARGAEIARGGQPSVA